MVSQVLQAGLVELRPADTTTDQALHRSCRRALEQLWDRREALARSLLAAAPADAVAPPALACTRALDPRDAALAAATSWCAQVLGDALAAARLQGLPADTVTMAQWPFGAPRWASTLRRIVERVSPVHEVRLELMRVGTRLLSPHIVEASRLGVAAGGPGLPGRVRRSLGTGARA